VKRRCACGARFTARTKTHRWCAACRKAHRAGRRCKVDGCATCARAFARLDAFNARREPENTCDACGMGYGAFRSGFSFLDARRDFITDEPNRKTGKRRHGRRHGVLGLMRQWKQLAWNAHIAACADAKGAA